MGVQHGVRGYGIIVDDAKWKKDAAELLYDAACALPSSLIDEAREFASDFDDGEWSDERYMFSDFVSDYENPSTFWSGLEGALTDFINEKYFACEEVFQYEDYCIYVEAYIPRDEEDKQKRPTCTDIQNILRQEINPLLEEELPIEWQEIRFFE